VTLSPAGTGLWSARHRSATGTVVLVTSGTDFPDGTVVDLPGDARRPAGWALEVHRDDAGSLAHRVVTADWVAPGAPLLWYVAVPVAAADLAELDLVAFSTTHRAEGDVLDLTGFRALGISWRNQVAAVRWCVTTGLVRQVYVAPDARRRRIGTKLVAAAAGVAVAEGWSSVHGDGRRTDLGEAWLADKSAAWQSRIAARTEHLPPMTPAGRTDGVPMRNLVPARGLTPGG
jgi:GNAT superfamily N-acetyltransferase